MIYTLMLITAITSQNSDMSSKPVPANSQGTWVNTSDYPSEALRQRSEGVSKFRLEVDEKGFVITCSIRRTSGSAILDEAACQAIMKNAKFIPAKNNLGIDVKGVFDGSVRWLLPDKSFTGELPFQASRMSKIILHRETDGSFSSCELDEPLPEIEKKSICMRTEQSTEEYVSNELFSGGLKIPGRLKIVISNILSVEVTLADSPSID